MNEKFKGGESKPAGHPLRRRLGEPSTVIPKEGQLTPEQRTKAFFNQDVMLLAKKMKGRLIVSQEDGKMIRIDNSEGWPVGKVGNRYVKSDNNLRLTELVPGTLGIFPLSVRKMKQSLVSAKSGEELGACVRLVRASKYDKDTNNFVPMPREGDIANYFDFKDNQAVKLKFLDNSETLYFNKGADNGVRVKVLKSTPRQAEAEVANSYLRDLIK